MRNPEIVRLMLIISGDVFISLSSDSVHSRDMPCIVQMMRYRVVQ